MGEINGLAFLVAVGIWIAACAVLLIALKHSRNDVVSPSRRGTLLALADEFLALTRQAERAGVAEPTSASVTVTADQVASRQRQAKVLLEVLRSQLTDDSEAVHHAEAMISMLVPVGGTREPALMDFHRSMFAGAIWEDVDRVVERPTRRHQTSGRRLRRARNVHLWHR